MPIKLVSPENEKPLAGNIPIWRYMGLEKFLDLITNNRIRFVRASLLSDKRELSLPLDQLESDYYKTFADIDQSSSKHQQAYEELRHMRDHVSQLKDQVFLNCWSIAQHESYALWKIYLGGAKAGIAIKSSVAALKKSFISSKDRTVHMSRVDYIEDVRTKDIPDRYFITNKSKHYEYEKELRLYALDSPNNHDAINWNLSNMTASSMLFDVDPSILINEIYLSPFVIGGFRKTIEQVIRKVNPDIRAKIHNSAVRDS